MHEHILSNRGVSLALLYEREKQRYVIKSSKQKDSDDNKYTAVAAASSIKAIGSAATSTTNTTTTSTSDITSVIKTTLNNNNNSSSRSVGGGSDNYDLTTKSSLQFLKENNLDLDVSDDDDADDLLWAITYLSIISIHVYFYHSAIPPSLSPFIPHSHPSTILLVLLLIINITIPSSINHIHPLSL